MKFDAQVRRRPGVDSAAIVRLNGYRVTDLTTGVGAAIFLFVFGAWYAGWSGLSVVEVFLAFAMFVLVSLGLGLVPTPRESGGSSPLYLVAVGGQLPAALFALVGFTQPIGVVRFLFLLPWAILTGVVGLYGLWRLGSHGITPLSAFAIDAGLLYLPVAGVFLLLHAVDVTFHFTSLIVLLTGVHFHYAGFALPLVVGLAGHHLQANEPSLFHLLFVAGTGGVIVGIGVIAVAITLSPFLELPAVMLFTLAVAAVAVGILRLLVPAVPRPVGLLLAGSAVSILLAMGLALAYAYSVFPLTGAIITIPEMIRWHGTLNAVGFALAGLLAFRVFELYR